MVAFRYGHNPVTVITLPGLPDRVHKVDTFLSVEAIKLCSKSPNYLPKVSRNFFYYHWQWKFEDSWKLNVQRHHLADILMFRLREGCSQKLMSFFTRGTGQKFYGRKKAFTHISTKNV